MSTHERSGPERHVGVSCGMSLLFESGRLEFATQRATRLRYVLVCTRCDVNALACPLPADGGN